MAGLEAVNVRALAEVQLLLEVGTNVVQLDLDLRVGGFKGSQTGKRLGSVGIAALLDQETGRLEVANR